MGTPYPLCSLRRKRERTSRTKPAFAQGVEAHVRESLRQPFLNTLLSEFLQPRVKLFREHVDPLHCFGVIKKPRLTHHQQMPKTAVIVVKFLNLPEDSIGIAGANDPLRNQILQVRLGVPVK